MRNYWWGLKDTTQRFVVIFGAMTGFLLAAIGFTFTPSPYESFGAVFFIGWGAISTWFVSYALNNLCFDPYEACDLHISTPMTLNGTVTPHARVFHTTLRVVDNNIKGLLECLRTDYWVRLFNEDFLDYTELVDGDENTYPEIGFGHWLLTDKMLAFESYSRHDQNPPSWMPRHGSALDLEVRAMFEDSIAAYFDVLPRGLALMHLDELRLSDVPAGLWSTIVVRMSLAQPGDQY